MTRTILWVDNDPAWTEAYRHALSDAGWRVDTARSPLAAEQALQQAPPDVLILDVMIPTHSADEAAGYAQGATGHGFDTGLQFYQRNRDLLLRAGTSVLILTVRLDEDIFAAFIAAGLSDSHIETKLGLRDARALVEKVESLATESTRTRGPRV